MRGSLGEPRVLAGQTLSSGFLQLLEAAALLGSCSSGSIFKASDAASLTSLLPAPSSAHSQDSFLPFQTRAIKLGPPGDSG